MAAGLLRLDPAAHPLRGRQRGNGHPERHAPPPTVSCTMPRPASCCASHTTSGQRPRRCDAGRPAPPHHRLCDAERRPRWAVSATNTARDSVRRKHDGRVMSPPCLHRIAAHRHVLYDGMQRNAMQCNAMQCNATQCNAMQCNALRCNAMHCTALHCTALHCTALQCNAV